MSVIDIFAAIRWWVALMILGSAAVPLTYRTFRVLPDRGYAFSKMVGLLIVSYLFWILGSLGFINNNLGGILLSILALILLSLWALKWGEVRSGSDTTTNSETIGSWLKQNWRYVLVVELIFTLIFVFWVWVRAQNPAIVATEKPMEFAFLNSATRSPNYPPLDPWLSGFAISYYYFGYVMTSVIGRVSAVQEQLAFNLANAWLIAGTGLAAFGIIFNLIKADSDATRRRAIIFGLIAAIALPIAGNMETALEVLHANDIGSDGLWEWIDIRDINGPSTASETPRYKTSNWWWWRSSRVIHEQHLSGRPEEGLEPIAEFPAFSFILGDLHPHVLALPYAFLGLAIALVWWLRPKRPMIDFGGWLQARGLKNQLTSLTRSDIALLLLTALFLGGLSFLNTWDVLIFLFIIVGSFVLAQWRVDGRWSGSILRQAITLAVGLSLAAILLYLPFYIGFRSQAGPPFLLPMSMRPTRLIQFLVIFIMPFIGILTLIGTLTLWTTVRARGTGRNKKWLTSIGLVTALVAGLFLLMLFLGLLIAMSPDGASRISSLVDELNLGLAPIPASSTPIAMFGWSVAAVTVLAPQYLLARINQPALILLLSLIIAAVIYLLHWLQSRPEHEGEIDRKRVSSSSLTFVLLLIGTGALLVIGPEFVYLRDNFGQRINTIFKFYYQAWVLFGVAAVYGLDYLLRRFKIMGLIATSFYSLALLLSLLFPYYAIQSRAVEYRGPATDENRKPITLDGLAYLESQNSQEYEALLWLRENVDGSPVIVEAVGGQYSGYGRVAATTGLPTLLGWAGHEYQWRGNTPEPAMREQVVASIYGPNNWIETTDLLDRYEVDYIYYGSLERSTYDPRGAEKFRQNLEVAFQNESVTIYRWSSSDES